MPRNSIYTIQNGQTFEFVRERSRFIALSFHVCSPRESREKLKEVMERFPQATHYAYAFRLGPKGEQEFASDGGEPKGSAGWPILGALRRHLVTDTMVVVLRYFGGKKLGIRGLIESYGYAAEKVLEISGYMPYVQKIRFTVKLAPNAFDLFVHRLLGFLRSKDGVYLDRASGVAAFSIAKNREKEVEELLQKECSKGTIIEVIKEG
ncbi:MAG: YigZ family protein [Atribacterota bacterium]